MTNDNGKFDPHAHLSDINGKDYLEVKWRIAWFRDDHPDGSIETEMVERTADQAIFRAKVESMMGGKATGWGSETLGDFGDFIEKAETKAIGRALAALGYGTQFCVDFDEGGAVTDAPVERKQAGRPPAPEPRATPANAERSMPLKFAGLCVECGWTIPAGTTALYNGSTKTVRHATGECQEAPTPPYTDNA
ncbi:MAG TPA: hypothetical protein VJB57_19245 [Dehalococcoidia bacterium]|nr:hypothetical protein [Dehalococcoidia bacterium]